MTGAPPERITVVVLVLATLVGLRLGATGPATSPVAPGEEPVSVVQWIADRSTERVAGGPAPDAGEGGGRLGGGTGGGR